MKNYTPPSIEERLLKDYSKQFLALAYFLSGKHSPYDVLKTTCGAISIEFSDSANHFRYGDNIHSHLYIVANEEDAEELFSEELSQYLQECILDELPDLARNYFDVKAWENDCRIEGRENFLAKYDGIENEEIIDGETFFIFRLE